MRKKRVIYLRKIYQDFLNKKSNEVESIIPFNKGDFRKIKQHWSKYKVIMP